LAAPVQFGQGCCFSFFSSSSTSIILVLDPQPHHGTVLETKPTA
jgi:hypothetical protein